MSARWALLFGSKELTPDLPLAQFLLDQNPHPRRALLRLARLCEKFLSTGQQEPFS